MKTTIVSNNAVRTSDPFLWMSFLQWQKRMHFSRLHTLHRTGCTSADFTLYTEQDALQQTSHSTQNRMHFSRLHTLHRTGCTSADFTLYTEQDALQQTSHSTQHIPVTRHDFCFLPTSIWMWDFVSHIQGGTLAEGGPGISVGIATGYRLDGPRIESRWGARFSAPVQTGPGAYPASCTMGTGSFPGLKRNRERGVDPSPPSSAVVKKG